MKAITMSFRELKKRASQRISDDGRRVCFAHVPKCGGTSIAQALRTSYSFAERVFIPETGINLRASERVAELFSRPMMDVREEILAYTLAQKNSRLAMGHVPCRPGLVNAFSHDWRFVTVLRHPIERFVSEYVYNTLKAFDWAKNDLPIAEYLESEKARATATSFLRYFSDFSLSNHVVPTSYVEEAVENLEQFAVVGFLEDLEGFKRDFTSRIGRKLDIPQRNKSPSMGKKSEIIQDQEIMAQIHRLCEADMMVYHRARDIVLGG